MKHFNVLLRDVPFTPVKDGPWTGVDAGVKGLLKAGIDVERAYGDFDSVSAEDIENFKEHLTFDIVPGVKDYTDSELALLSLAERSEEHTSELQSRFDLVCRLLLEKKTKIYLSRH